MSTKPLNDAALEEYYAALFLMYGGDGWKKLMEDFGRMQETHDGLAGLETVEQLWFRKGQVDLINFLLAHQATNEAAYASLLSEQEGAEEEAPTGGVARVVE